MKPENIFIEKYKLGELSENEFQILKNEYPDDESLKNELERLEASNDEILDKYTPEKMAEAIQRRLEEKSEESVEDETVRVKSFPFLRFAKYASVAAAAALIIVFGMSFYNPVTSTGSLPGSSNGVSAERIKGLTPEINIYRQRGDSIEELSNRDRAVDRDLLQIEYIAGSFNYGVIFSIDGYGVVTLHFPSTDGKIAKLDNNGAVLLPYAYELDDAPGFERFFFVTGREDFNIDEVLDAAYELASRGNTARRDFLDIPEDYYQTTILLRKGAE